MKQNIFDSENQNATTINGENIVNLRKRKVVRLYMHDGTFHEVVSSDTLSMPDGKGGWIDQEISADYVDDLGNPLPKDMNGVAISCTGRLIPLGRLAACNSGFHPQNMTRNIYMDIDGSIIDSEPICTICQQRRRLFNAILIFVGIGFVIGIFNGFGWF